ncbi:protein kinase [Archangium violaceum]|uniref:serine/threonine protein kinase n=1 Tax=Archangium violaceum TaxID=83451 RepID=UPI00194DB377|nr:serine/threonine-protein kinase [Archangium violaceum]QRN94007.1 protein kinase [Archangium violaceum]
MSIETYGNYQLIKRLAMGGMAQIYLARQRGPEGFEKLLVVKRILPHLAENEDFVRMFLDEARIAARLNHPNIVQIFNLGAQDDSFFIAMEYIHGEDLRRVWKRAERSGQLIPVPLVCRIIIEACAGLDYAHKKTDANNKPLGIVHRDISPQNILVTFEGRVKVVDFGIAKAADQATVTRSGVLKGKYSYMSPEQAAGQKLDRRSDIFALGVVLYELLTGTRLFKRPSDMSTLQAVAECKILPPSQVNSRVPAHLDPIVMKALTRDPADRYAEAVQLQLALEDWLVAHQLPSSSAHVSTFMQDLYAARLAEEARLGDVLVEEAEILSGGFKAVEKSGAETMAAPRSKDEASARNEADAARTQPLESTAGQFGTGRMPARPSRSESRGTSERKGVEPRRTVDIRRAPAPEPVEEPPRSTPSEKPAVRVSRAKQPAVPPRRKSKRLAVVGVTAGVLVGLGLGAWWALSSTPAPEATRPATAQRPVEPKPSESSPGETPKPAVAASVKLTLRTKPEQVALTVDGKPLEKGQGVVSAMPGQELNLLAEAPRHRPLSRTVRVGEGPTQEVVLELEPLAESPREEHKPEPARAAVAAVERPSSQETRRGSVRFAVTPWAEVACGGRNLGTTPLPDVQLPAGVYECKFSNPEMGTRTQRVEVKANTHTRVLVKF